MTRQFVIISRLFLVFIFISSCLLASVDKNENFNIPFGLPEVPWPADNPYSKKKEELGRLLYFDKRLSTDGTISCATCHIPEEGYADHHAQAIGIKGRIGKRNSPTVINSAYLTHLFWDGRVSSLEEQCKGPISNPNEMTLIENPHWAHQECHKKIMKIPGYKVLFKEVFGCDLCTLDDMAKAIATFERTVLSGNSPYDRYRAGDKTALTQEQILGLKIFKKSGCDNCHAGFNFTDGRFLNIGIGTNSSDPDLGRYAITKNEKDWAAFKVPGLRDIDKSFPYMHDGSLQTLEDVVDYYDKGGIPNKNLHPLIRPLHLSEEEKKALVSFMHSLNGEGWQNRQQELKKVINH